MALEAVDLHYDLPEDLIAQHPSPTRTAARMLHVPAAGAFAHLCFADLPGLLREGDLLVLNETRVIPARLALHRRTGGAVEALLLREEGAGWRALVRPAKRLREGEELIGGGGAFTARVMRIDEGGSAVLTLSGPAKEVMGRFGSVPLPPYVRREATAEDEVRYQTVYARVPGAVAAPTAGLHFDEEMLERVRLLGVRTERLVLHTGPGTFRPLPDGPLDDHSLDPERFEVPDTTRQAVEETQAASGRVIAVGTTVVRALEAAVRGANGETDLFIVPPFRFRAVDCLITNFHLPRSSLLCLVAAFCGRERILAAYEEAVRERYRFYSYGDATFLERA